MLTPRAPWVSSAGGIPGSPGGEDGATVVVVFFVSVVVLDETALLILFVVPHQYLTLAPATVTVAASLSVPTTAMESLLAVSVLTVVFPYSASSETVP